MSAARLAEFGCLAVLEQYHQKPSGQGYAAAMEQIVDHRAAWKIPAYVVKPEMRRLKDKAIAQRNARLWGPDGHFTKRLPRRGANQPEQETA